MMRRTNRGIFASVAFACAGVAGVLFSGCDKIELPEAAHDRGGVTFDFKKLSEERFPAERYPAVGKNLLENPWCGKFTNGEDRVVALPHNCGGKYRIVAETKVRPVSSDNPMRDTAIMIRLGNRRNGGTGAFVETPRRGEYVWNGFMKHSDRWYVATKVFDVRPGETHALVMLKCDTARIEIRNVALCEEVAQPVEEKKTEVLEGPMTIRVEVSDYIDHAFYISQNQAGEMAFTFKKPKGEKYDEKKGIFRLDLPSGIEFVDANFGALESAKTTKRADGSSVTEFRPHRDFRGHPSAAWWTSRYLILRSTGSCGTNGVGRLVFACSDKDRTVRASSKDITFVTVPTISAPQPKAYGMGGWQSGAYLFENLKNVDEICKFHAACGQNWIIPNSATDYPALATWRANGFKYVTPQTANWCINGYQLGQFDKVPLDQRMTTIKGADPRYIDRFCNSVCPTAVMEGTPYVKDVALPRIAAHAKGVDGLWANWEPYWYKDISCSCLRCGRHFAKFLGQDWNVISNSWPACAFPGGAYAEKGREFRSRCHGEVVKIIDKTVRAVTGKNSVGFMPGIHFGQMTSSWRTNHPMPEASPEHYAADIPWVNLWGPYVAWRCSHRYFKERARHVAHVVAARDFREQIAADYPKAKRPHILTAPQGTCGEYFNQPEAFEMNFDVYFFNGFAGCCPWVFPLGADARYWRAFANASAKAAKYEEVVSNGEAADSSVSLQTVAEFAAPVDRILPYLAKWRNVPQIATVSYDYARMRVVAVFNCWQMGEAFFTLKVANLPAGDYRIVSNDGVLWAKDARHATYTAQELAQGVFLSVGSCRTRVFEIVPAGTKPLTTPTSFLTAVRLRGFYAERQSALAALAAVDAKEAEDDLAGVSWYD